MGYKSKMEYPPIGPSNDALIRRVTAYIDKGLTNTEASDLVTIESVEEREEMLFPAEIARKRAYLEKLKTPESK